MLYTDRRGQQHRLTRTQAGYLELANNRGFGYGWGGYRSTQTVRLLEERGLITMRHMTAVARWEVACGLPHLGQQVLEQWRNRHDNTEGK